MIIPAEPADLAAIQRLIETAIRRQVARDEAEAEFLVADVGESLDEWQHAPGRCLHLKYLVPGDPGEGDPTASDRHPGRLAGVVLVKDWWNLTNLFVHPDFQGRGIGRQLAEAAIEACRGRSPSGELRVNSSSFAVPFYRRLGFEQLGPGRDRPGGCVPFRYDLARSPG